MNIGIHPACLDCAAAKGKCDTCRAMVTRRSSVQSKAAWDKKKKREWFSLKLIEFFGPLEDKK